MKIIWAKQQPAEAGDPAIHNSAKTLAGRKDLAGRLISKKKSGNGGTPTSEKLEASSSASS